MASGTIYGTTDNKYIEAKVEWSSVANNDTNTSEVTASLYYKRNGGYPTFGHGLYYITINGVKSGELSGGTGISIDENSWILVGTYTVTVSHNTDGNKSITISASGGMYDGDFESTTLSGAAVLDTIPRASTIDSLSCATTYFTGTMTYKYTPVDAVLYNRCVIALNLNGVFTQAKDMKIGQKTASQQTEEITLSESELSIIYNGLPTTARGILRFTFYTYTDSAYSVQVGDATYKEIRLYIPNDDSTKPTATLVVFPVNSFASPFNSMYIKGKSKITIDFTDMSGKYGATITNHSAAAEGKGGITPYTSEAIIKDGEITVTGNLTDSRGFSRLYTQTVTFLPYISPRVLPASGESAVVCARCDALGTIKEDGTYLKIKAKRSYSSLNSKNTCSIRYRYKGEGGTYSDWITILQATDTNDEVTTGALLGGTLLVTSSYVVQVGVIDALGETDFTTIYISTSSVYMHRAGSRHSLGIGKYVEDDNVIDIAEDMTTIFRGKVSFMGEIWNTLTYGADVVEGGIELGRYGGTGVFYRESKGENQVYIVFNVKFVTRETAIQVAAETIPNPPQYDVYAMCPVAFSNGSRGVAIVNVSPSGTINICEVYKMPGATLSVGDTVEWIDGYIDYWI